MDKPKLDWPLACIACGKKPEPVFTPDPAEDKDDQFNWQPYGATTFNSYGQYGSTVFDEMGRSQLMINVCDQCLRTKAKEGVIALVTPIHRPQDHTYEAWLPYEPEED